MKKLRVGQRTRWKAAEGAGFFLMCEGVVIFPEYIRNRGISPSIKFTRITLDLR